MNPEIGIQQLDSDYENITKGHSNLSTRKNNSSTRATYDSRKGKKMSADAPDNSRHASRKSNDDRAQWRTKCREKLSEHIRKQRPFRTA
jgi:hypothetical protein